MKTQNFYYAFFCAAFLFAASKGIAQEALENDSKTFQFTFIYPTSTNGEYSSQVDNKYSLNLLAGYNGGVNAFELGGIYNVVRRNVEGVQLSGFGNTVGGHVRGFQLGGFLNTNKGYVQGAQVAGFLNLVSDSVSGFQFGGFSNITKSVRGFQLAGFSNVTGSSRGFQFAGFNNHSQDKEGAQIAGLINTSGDMEGFQFAGFINKAKKVDGVQFSIINLADSVASGTQLGLVNISKKNGFISGAIETDDVIPYRIAFRSGQDHFYTVLTAGIKPDDYWSFGAGFGSRLFLSQQRAFYLNPELRWHSIQEDKIEDGLENHLVRLNLNLGRQLNEHFYITGGPSINYYFTDNLDSFGRPVIDLVSNPTVDRQRSDNRHQVWIGYTVAIGFQ